MNLSESMKLVLKTRSQNIITDFWKSDVKSIIQEAKTDFGHFISRAPRDSISLKHGIGDLKDSTFEFVTLVASIPGRVKKGFALFREDFLRELDNLEDSKEKTIFCIKVIGALTSFAVGTFYGIKKAKHDYSTSGLRTKNALTHFLAKELVLRLSQLFILRFLAEVEREVTEPEELRKLRFFKKMLLESKEDGNYEELSGQDPQDPAFAIVESLKQYLLNGHKEF